MNYFKHLIIVLHQWSLSHPKVARVAHTFWQVGLAFLIANTTGIHNAHDAKIVLTAAVAAGLSAAKSQLWPILVSYAAQSDPHITQV